VGTLAQNFNFAQQPQLPDSLKDLANDARLNIAQIKTRYPLLVQHQEMCSLTDCPILTRPTYYMVTLRDMDRVTWGSIGDTSTFDIGIIISEILNRCEPDQTLESFMNLLKSPWFKKYHIAKLLSFLKPYDRRQFYHFLTQRLLHLCQDRVVCDKNSSQPLSRWPCITFLTFHPSDEVIPGIYFLYTPQLDIFQENIKITLFEPVLNYLSCLINTCPVRKESFCTFMNSQKHLGIFSQQQHNHIVLDCNWKFFFPTQNFLLLEEINNERRDLICSCLVCKNSLVVPTIPRFMLTDYKSFAP